MTDRAVSSSLARHEQQRRPGWRIIREGCASPSICMHPSSPVKTIRRGWNPCGRAHANDVQSDAQPVFRLQTSCCTSNFSALHSRFSGSSARQGRHTSVVCREVRTSPSPWRSIRGCLSHPGPIPVSWFWVDAGMVLAHDIARFKRLRHCCSPVAPYKIERGHVAAPCFVYCFSPGSGSRENHSATSAATIINPIEIKPSPFSAKPG